MFLELTQFLTVISTTRFPGCDDVFNGWIVWPAEKKERSYFFSFLIIEMLN